MLVFALPALQLVPSWQWGPSRIEDPAYIIFTFLGYSEYLEENNYMLNLEFCFINNLQEECKSSE